jgi:hypothetical protein
VSLVSQLTEIEVEISILEISILFEDELQFCDEPGTSESGPMTYDTAIVCVCKAFKFWIFLQKKNSATEVKGD